jgi:hypothetical protein
MDFLGDIPFLQRYLMTTLISNFSVWSKWHAPLLTKVCFMLLNLYKTACNSVSIL